MNDIIMMRGNEQELLKEIEKAGSQYPVFMRDRVKEAFQAADEGEYEKAEGICCELLDHAPAPEILMFLGTCYFVQGKMPVARQVFSVKRRHFSGIQESSFQRGCWTGHSRIFCISISRWEMENIRKISHFTMNF